MTEFSDDIVDISSLNGQETPEKRTSSLRGRPWVGIRFDCCGVYSRIYRNRPGTEYAGRCPRCGRRVKLKVGPGGTSARFFIAE